MELESVKQMVIQASTTFYSTQDKEQRRTAEEWLNDFKKSINAWYVVDQILHSSRDEQALFFAAQTIRSKIQSSFHELPAPSHEVSIFLFECYSHFVTPTIQKFIYDILYLILLKYYLLIVFYFIFQISN